MEVEIADKFKMTIFRTVKSCLCYVPDTVLQIFGCFNYNSPWSNKVGKY